MTLLNSCCCCKSIRKACYACAIFSIIYYVFLIISVWQYLENHERAKREKDFKHSSVLTPDPVEGDSWIIYLIEIELGLSIIGIGSSISLIIGIWKDKKLLLLPWIIDAPCIILSDVIYVAYLGYEKRMSPKPEVAMVLTVDFFLLILNSYALLCVISQFQEYNAGRGRVTDDGPEAGLSVQFCKTAPLMTNSCETGRRNVAVYESKSQANGISPKQSRMSFRGPSIRVSKPEKGIANEDNETQRTNEAAGDVNCQSFVLSECGPSSEAATSTSVTPSCFSGNDESKRAVPVPKDYSEGKESFSADQVPDTSETSATTECESTSGRSWIADKSLESSPLISLPAFDEKSKY